MTRLKHLPLVLVLALAPSGPIEAQTPDPTVEAWAMLIQMMGRLRTEVAEHELSAIHLEDPIANAAVSSLLPPASGLTRGRLVEFGREISALHTAADAGDEKKCAELIAKAQVEFEQLQKEAKPEVLRAAEQLAERRICPMHPDVRGAKDTECPKCGMPLDQRVVLLPAQAGSFAEQKAVKVTIDTDGPLAVGQRTLAVLHLVRPGGEPVQLGDLIETHTKRIHLLIVDESLTDYHHEHPRLTETPGDYVFDFTPRKPGPYLVWADLRPLPLGLQEYDKVVLPSPNKAQPISDRQTRLSAEVDGYHFELILTQPEIKAGQPAPAKLRVTKADGSGFTQLEPVMAAFAHVVGFNEDLKTVLHMHPTGPPVLDENARGGPELPLTIYAAKAGFTRLFAQVQIGGLQVFAPFNVTVAP